MRISIYIAILLPTLTLCFSTTSFSQQNIISVEPTGVLIDYASPPASESNSSLPFKQFCKNLSRALVISDGSFSGGPFAGSLCSQNGTVIDGTAEKSQWELKIFHSDNLLTFSLAFKWSAKERPVEEARFQIPFNEKMIVALMDEEVAADIAYKLLDSLPINLAVRGAKLNQEGLKGLQGKSALRFSDSISTFELKYHAKLKRWLPYNTNVWKRSKQGGFQIHDRAVPIDTRNFIFVQNRKGRLQRSEEIDDELNQHLERYGISQSLFKKWLGKSIVDTLASGYVGARYGYPLARNDPLISKAAMVSVFTEVRGGPLKGLRWYWDVVPKVKARVENELLTYTWSRPSLGWSFGFATDWKLINRIDATPKFGLLDFDAQLPLKSSLSGVGIVGRRVRLKNEPNLGLEVGVESVHPWFLLRLWGSRDASGLVNISKSGSVSSQRLGLDTYWDMTKIGGFEVSLLIFTFWERLSIGFNSKASDIASIHYQQAFAGLGVTLTW
ncbi:MAG: hypothetical protein AB7T49_17595 [Oligoflexales bacterium]